MIDFYRKHYLFLFSTLLIVIICAFARPFLESLGWDTNFNIIFSSILISSIVGIYYVLAQKEFKKRKIFSLVEEKKWADSVYFLGFIGTLVSLIAALGFYPTTSGDGIIGATLVQNAIALSSTAVALFLRQIWLFNIDESEIEDLDPKTFEKELASLTKTIRGLRTQGKKFAEILTSSSEEVHSNANRQVSTFNTYVTRVSTEFAESLKDQQSEISKSTAEFSKEIATAGEKINNINLDSELISDQVKDVVENVLVKVGRQIDEQEEKLTQVVSRFNQALEDLVAKTRDTNIADMMEVKIKGVFLPLQKAAEEGKDIVTQVRTSIEGAKKAVDGYTELLLNKNDSISESIEWSLKQQEQVLDSTKKFDVKLEDLLNNPIRLGELDNLAVLIESLISRLEKINRNDKSNWLSRFISFFRKSK